MWILWETVSRATPGLALNQTRIEPPEAVTCQQLMQLLKRSLHYHFLCMLMAVAGRSPSTVALVGPQNPVVPNTGRQCHTAVHFEVHWFLVCLFWQKGLEAHL